MNIGTDCDNISFFFLSVYAFWQKSELNSALLSCICMAIFEWLWLHISQFLIHFQVLSLWPLSTSLVQVEDTPVCVVIVSQSCIMGHCSTYFNFHKLTTKILCWIQCQASVLTGGWSLWQVGYERSSATGGRTGNLKLHVSFTLCQAQLFKRELCSMVAVDKILLLDDICHSGMLEIEMKYILLSIWKLRRLTRKGQNLGTYPHI